MKTYCIVQGAVLHVLCCSAAWSCLTLCNTIDCSTPGFPGGLGSKEPACNAGVKTLSSDSLQSHGLYSLPGSSIHGISQARMLECVAISFSGESSWPRDQTQVSCISGRLFTIWATREAQPGLNPQVRKSPGEGNGNSLQYSCLDNSLDRGVWWTCKVHGVAKSQAQLSN